MSWLKSAIIGERAGHVVSACPSSGRPTALSDAALVTGVPSCRYHPPAPPSRNSFVEAARPSPDPEDFALALGGGGLKPNTFFSERGCRLLWHPAAGVLRMNTPPPTCPLYVGPAFVGLCQFLVHQREKSVLADRLPAWALAFGGCEWQRCSCRYCERPSAAQHSKCE